MEVQSGIVLPSGTVGRRKCAIVGVLPAAEYPHDQPFENGPKVKEGSGCSAQGLGVAN